MALYKLIKIGVRHQDGRNIVASNENRDWREYLQWLADGNTPDPLDPDTPSRDEIDTAAAKMETDIKALAAFTPAEARAWVIANVTTLADARTTLARFAAVLCVLTRRL